MRLNTDDHRTGRRGTTGAGKILPSSGKVLKCPYCTYTTNVNTNLKKHARTHTGEKPYACPYCPFRASQTENLKRHIRTHTGEKPFACSFCTYRSTERSSLKNHMWVHHPSGNLQTFLVIQQNDEIYHCVCIFCTETEFIIRNPF